MSETIFELLKKVDFHLVGLILENDVLTGLYKPFIKKTGNHAPMISGERFPYLHVEIIREAGFVEFNEIPKIIENPSMILNRKFEIKYIE